MEIDQLGRAFMGLIEPHIESRSYGQILIEVDCVALEICGPEINGKPQKLGRLVIIPEGNSLALTYTGNNQTTWSLEIDSTGNVSNNQGISKNEFLSILGQLITKDEVNDQIRFKRTEIGVDEKTVILKNDGIFVGSIGIINKLPR